MKTAITLSGTSIAFSGRIFFVKLTMVFMLCAGMQVHAKSFGQERINIQLKQSTFKNFLHEVEKQTWYRFVYHTGSIPGDKKVNVSVKDANLDEVLGQAFSGLSLNYTVKEDNLVVIFPKENISKFDKIIRGTVRDANGSPLTGVSVMVSATNIGTTTNTEGFYTLQIPTDANTLEFSLVGFSDQKISIENQQVIDIVLQQVTTTLGEIVVTGYTNYSRSKSASAVTIVGGDKINNVPVATFEQSLQGRVPGLSVSSMSGQPGTSAKVILRGIGSIAGNNAVLYVMDGVPIESGYFQSINPGDIESVTVLKDASSKAIYGSRGANGVIVISTKKGKAEKISVDYKSQYGLSTLTSTKFRMMNTSERKVFEEELGLETGSESGPFWTYSKLNPDYANKTASEKQEADQIVDSLLKINNDWRKLFMRDGSFIEQQVSASGGNEKIRFYSSVNYFDQQGLVKVSNLRRYTLKNNVDFSYGRLSANLDMNIGYSKSNLIQNEGRTGGRNPLSAVYYALPYEFPFAPDGKLVTSGDGSDYPVLDLREGSDSYERMLNTTNKQEQLKTIFGGSISYRLTKGLIAKTKVGIDYRDETDEQWVNPDSYAGRKESGRLGSFGQQSIKHTSLISTTGLTYKNLFASDHDVEISGLFEFLRNQYKSFGFTGYGLDPRLPQTPAGIGDPGTFTPELSGSRTSNAMASYIGLMRYTYKDKYTLNGSLRYDGSSTLPEINRWHGFYSIGASWEAKREQFLENITTINDLRLRASYGTTASPFPSNFAYLPTYERSSYGGNPAIIPVQPGNPMYDWEYAKELNIGFDLGIIENRIRLTVELYNRITSNLFIDKPLSFTSGFSDLSISSGSMRNRGVELDLHGDLIRAKNVLWSVGANMAYNKNVVLDLGGSDEFEYQYTGIIRVGLPYGSHYAVKWAGVDPANGNPLYYTPDGKITEKYNSSTMSVADLGTYIPAITGGVNTSFAWNDFYFNALLSFVAKVTRYNNEDYFNENPSFTTSNQSIRLLYDRWKKPGDNAILPVITAPRYFTSRDMQDASYLRLRNVNLGYNLSQSIIQKWKFVKEVQINLQAQNLLTWTKWRGFDPENGNEYARFSYPAPKTFVAGLNIKF